MQKANLSLFDHLLSYKMPPKPKAYRATQIIGTITSNLDKDVTLRMIENGMNIAAFSVDETFDVTTAADPFVTTRESVVVYNQNRFDLEKKKRGKFAASIPVHVATALDIKGTYMKTGNFQNEADFDGEIVLTNNENEQECTKDKIFIDFVDLASLPVGQTVIIGNSEKEKVIFKVTSQEPNGTLKATTTKPYKLPGGDLSYNVILPGAKIQITSVVDQVITLSDFCRKNSIDMIFAPVTDAKTFQQIACMAKADESPIKIKIIAKLEGQDAVDNVDKIIECADGVLVSRNRLARMIRSPEQVIIYQKNVIAKCLKGGIPSIVASDVMKSVEPTRADLADVFNAVMEGADCIMLCEKASKTSNVKKLHDIMMEAEDIINFRRLNRELLTQVSIPPKPNKFSDYTETVAVAACTAAMIHQSNAIIVLTHSGRTARKISKFRPVCPIIAVTTDEAVARQCLLFRGVYSIVHDDKKTRNFRKGIEARVETGIEFAKMCNLFVKYPGNVVCVLASDQEGSKTNSFVIVPVEEDKVGDE